MIQSFLNPIVLQNIKYYGVFQLMFIVAVMIISSLGAFFHFLLDHEISIVESWLHNNQWEILISSKFISLFLLNHWFKVRLYQFKTFKTHLKELFTWPSQKALVVSFFMLVAYIALGEASFVERNNGYWYFQVVSFLSLFTFFGIEFIVIGYLRDILSDDKTDPHFILGFLYSLLFFISLVITIPNYYKLIPHTMLCFTTLLYLSGQKFRDWSHVFCFLIIFVAPMGSLFGLDPVWGDDFSLFKFSEKPKLSFLAVVWVISFTYYLYRDRILGMIQKILR